jgi:TolA-binding protein
MALRLLIAILILAVPAELPGCGPFLPEALFFDPLRPDRPAEEFARGQLGIVQPTYERLYQVIAYRYLTGVGLNDAERREIFHAGPVRFPFMAMGNDNPWIAARNKVSGIKPVNYIAPFRAVEEPGHYEVYQNCNDDAFATAAATLQDRTQRFGATAPAVADWIAAQDMVFSNCSKGKTIPQPSADPRMRADRAYQIASAKFYSEQYGEARQDFLAIAQDESSPWHDIAPYLAARCLIRSGKLSEAETELQQIASEPSLPRWHAPAGRLLAYIHAHLRPAQRMHEAAEALVQPDSQATIAQDLTDYRVLFDKDVEPRPNDDLTDWILSFQAYGRGAVEQWRARHTLPWLIAALQAAHPGDSTAPELLAAAREVKPDSPGFVTVGYHMVRLLPPNDARAKAGEMLAGKLPLSARNQFRARRLELARSFEEFLEFAPRRPVAESTFAVAPVEATRDFLDQDSTLVLNRDIPLALLKQASTSALLPDSARERLKDVAWVRTLLLSDSPAFAEVFALLNAPGMRPYVDSGYGRNTGEVAKIDPYHDNWWCSSSAINLPNNSVLLEAPPTGAPFLSAADRDQAAAEWKKLLSVATAPDWLGAQTLAFAQAHPQDPRVPEALYLAVRATRYGCTGKATGDFSHRAFDLLHRRYPNTEWAKKTPYWFD